MGHGHHIILPQAGLATADRFLCEEKQRQVGATGGSPESTDATPAHQIGLYETICQSSLDKELEAFKYLQDFFLNMSQANFKAGVFVGPHILEYNEFRQKLNRKEKAAWKWFGDSWAITRPKIMWSWLRLVKKYGTKGYRMSLKVLGAHLDKFEEDMGAYAEEQDERFHQDILDFERCYKGQYNENMMADYI